MCRTTVRPALLTAALACACAFILAPPGAFATASGVWPVSSAEVLLGHGDTYEAGAGSRTHRGADIAAEPGEEVACALDGQVTFAGRVPSGDTTVLAVSVLAGDVKLTYMPLQSASVSVGDAIAAGERLGAVADGGDASSARSHVHVSARRDDLYLDPLSMLAAPAPAAVPDAPEPATQATGSEQPTAGGDAEEQAPTPAHPAARPAPASTAGVPAAGAAASQAPAPTPQPAPTPAAAPPPVTTTASAGTAAPAATVRVASSSPVAQSAPAVHAARARGAGRALLGMGSSPVVGLRLPGIAECALAAAASVLLAVGLGSGRLFSPVVGAEPALVAEDRR